MMLAHRAGWTIRVFRSRGGARAVLRTALFCVALVTLLPTAAAVDTLATFEAPHGGSDKLFPFVMLREEAGHQHGLIYRNSAVVKFTLDVVAANGTVVFHKNGTRGIQTLPDLEPGDYTFHVHGDNPGSFQVTDRVLDVFRNNTTTDVTTRLSGEADAYILTASRNWYVKLSGSVDVEWFDLTTPAARKLIIPANETADVSKAYILTVTGHDGAPYEIHLYPREVSKGAPGLAPIAFLGALLLATAFRRRRG